MIAPVLWGVLYFFAVCLGAADSIKGAVMFMTIFSLLMIAVRFRILRDRISWPFIALTLCVLMDGISTFYAVSGKFALREFLKVFLAYLLAVILLAASPKKEETTGKRIATILAVCTAFGSLASIDLISTRWISGAVTGVLGLFSDVYKDLSGLNYDNSRLSSLFINQNVFGGFSGLGILLSLGLYCESTQKKERRFFISLLQINAIAFLLSNNRGAFVFIFLALVLFLLMIPREKRTGTTLSLVMMAVLTVASVLVITKTSFRKWEGFQIIPLLCIIADIAACCVLDAPLQKLICAFAGKETKKSVIIPLSVLILLLLYGVTAVSVTKDVTIPGGHSLTRIAFLKPGSYCLEVQTAGEPLNVKISSQNLKEIMQKETSTLCYTGSEKTPFQLTFEVPEDSVLVSFTFQWNETVHLLSASCNGRRIPLRYPLIPEFIVTRLHNASLLYSAVQRLIYFRDGLKLFRRSPVIGLGMGAFENGIKSVQSYYYETKYAHNHYFQTMLETGLVGLLLFLALIVTSGAAIWRSRKKHPYAPMLGAALIFMAGQAVHDIVFSAYAYLPIAYGVFAMTNLSCGEAVEKPKLTRTVKTVILGVIVGSALIYSFFVAQNMVARRQANLNPTFETLAQSAKTDQFEWADYALPYVINAGNGDVDSRIKKQADRLAERLAKVNSNTIPIYLAEYYFKTARNEQGIAMLEKYVDYVSSDQNAWQNAFNLLRAYNDESALFRDGIVQMVNKLTEWNMENVGSIQLDEQTNAWIAEYTNH